MKLLKIISVLFLVLCLSGFSEKKQVPINVQQIPADFYFTIDSDRADGYNSLYNSFYRNYNDGEKTIKVELTKEEKEKIYSYIKKVNFFEMPIEFKAKGIIEIKTPSFKEVIVVYANGKKSFVSYNDGYTNDLNDKNAKPFLDLYKMIWDILYNKKEIEELPKSDCRYGHE
ncbi:hypothetical protein [Flavobacterium daemonense]|uniref:hypothetical protein n=1 Tax=Flavobacterium daemonense TaxID=1393049 RepID=UPI00118697F5|nr:hypothetical protein [Flavobacterium daemonense]KAF2334343.1 hypothetical protein FND99_08565 [Flavobacterium daemonense]